MSDLVTLTEAQTYLRLDSVPDELPALVSMVSAAVERYIGRPVVAQDVEEVLDSGGGELLFLRYFPLQGEPQVVDQQTGETVAGFVTYSKTGVLAKDGGWPAGRQRYRVTYRAGLVTAPEAVPEDLKLAVLEWVAARYHRRDPSLTQERIGDYSYQAQENGIPAGVKALLDLYRAPGGR